jgi:hypothetical protein
VEEHLRIILGCLVIFAIGIGFGIAFRVARSDGHPRPTTVLKVDRATTAGEGASSSP